MMASELRIDPLLLKRCTVLHDIGKALLGGRGQPCADWRGDRPPVRRAGGRGARDRGAHQTQVEVRTVEAVLTQAADAISGGPPGARRESLEMYVKRLKRLEQIAGGDEGVRKVFAMQACGEIRLLLQPDRTPTTSRPR